MSVVIFSPLSIRIVLHERNLTYITEIILTGFMPPKACDSPPPRNSAPPPTAICIEPPTGLTVIPLTVGGRIISTV